MTQLEFINWLSKTFGLDYPITKTEYGVIFFDVWDGLIGRKNRNILSSNGAFFDEDSQLFMIVGD